MKITQLNLLTAFFLCIYLQKQSFAQETDSLPETDIERLNYGAFTAKNRILVGLDFGMGIGVRNQNINFNNATALVDFNVSPRVGMFLGKGWLLGLDFDYFGSVASFNFQNEYRFLLRSYSGYARYYTPSGLMLELTMGHGDGNEKFIAGDEVQSIGFEGFRYGLGVGIANYWTERVCFEILLRYTGSAGSYKQVEEKFFINGLSLGAGVSVSLGK